MKLKNLLQKLMAIVAVMILVAHLLIGALLDTDSASSESFLWMITLIICIGTVIYPISEKAKPLDWVLGGSFLGSCICLCALLGLSDKVLSPGLFFTLYLLEFLLSGGYKIGRRLGILDSKKQLDE